MALLIDRMIPRPSYQPMLLLRHHPPISGDYGVVAVAGPDICRGNSFQKINYRLCTTRWFTFKRVLASLSTLLLLIHFQS